MTMQNSRFRWRAFKAMNATVVLSATLSLYVSSARATDTDFQCGEAMSDAQLVAQVERQYEQITDLVAAFEQSSYFLGTDERRSSGGRVYFLRPGRMDWVYSRPDEQRFVSDGTDVWWYQPNVPQVTIRRLDQSFVT